MLAFYENNLNWTDSDLIHVSFSFRVTRNEKTVRELCSAGEHTLYLGLTVLFIVSFNTAPTAKRVSECRYDLVDKVTELCSTNEGQ